MKNLKIIVMCFFMVTVSSFSSQNLKQGKEKFKEIRRSINETIQDKVLKGNDKSKMQNIESGFQNSKERMDLILLEEKELDKIASEVGINLKGDKEFLGEQFNLTHQKFLTKDERMTLLKNENEKLKKYLNKLDEMEKSLTK